MRPPGALEVLEEAVHLLRSVSAEIAAVYLLGALPFTLGLLYFFTDMAQNPFASERLPWESFAVAVLLVWKSVWQAVFQAKLFHTLSSDEIQPIPFGRLFLIQSVLQPIGFFVAIPLSLMVTLPFAWVLAFFRNVGLSAALADKDPIGAARAQARLMKIENWQGLGMITLAALLLFANIVIIITLLPQLGRSFLGIEGDFARLGIGILNPLTFAVAVSLMWLAIDPLIDAFYVVRYFHGVSLATGKDLRVSLRAIVNTAALALLLLISAPAIRAQDPAPQNTSIDAGRLERSIDQVIRRREFAWRAPKPEGPEPEGGWVSWIRGVEKALNNAGEWLAKKLQEWFKVKPDSEDKQNAPVERPPVELLIAVVAVVLAGALIAVFLRSRRSPDVKAQAVTPTAAKPDMTDESITADQLPESSWLELAEEWLAKGDYRLAMRALYLAGLNYLANRKLVAIQRSKTGREYRRELERAARLNPVVDASLGSVFGGNVLLFERAWYGRYPVERGDVEAFASGLEEIRRHAGPA